MAVKFELDKKTLKRLRNATNPSGQKINWLSGLNDDMLIELYGRLRNGEKYLPIARRYQEKYGYCPHGNQVAMSQTIKKFAKEVLPVSHLPRDPTATKPKRKKTKKQKERSDQRSAWDRHIEEMNREFSALDRMIQAAELQWKRIQLLTKTEQDWSSISSNADKMIERFFGYAERILQQQVKLKIIDAEAPKQILELRGQLKIESPDVVIAAMGDFMQKAIKEKALLLEPIGEAGRYQLPEATDARPGDDEEIPSEVSRDGSSSGKRRKSRAEEQA